MDCLRNNIDKKCGEVFLTLKGSTIYHCTICECKYNEIQSYGIHIIGKHVADILDVFKIPTEQIENSMPKIPDILLKQSSNIEMLDEWNISEFDNFEYEIDEITLENDDNYDKQCGEVHLTQKGILIFNCIICNTKYKGIKLYNQHVIEIHYTSNAVEENKLEIFFSQNMENNTEEKVPDSIDLKKSTKPIPKWKETFETFYCTKTNQELYKCKLCAVVIRDKTNITAHIRRIHEKIKRYKCNECQRMFHSGTELKFHIRHHTGEKPYLCFECGKAFITASQLQVHKKKKHTVLIKDKACTICGKTFTTQRYLNNHKTVHSKERPFKCKICNAGFKVKSSLRLHNRIHEDKRMFKCNLCSASYNYKSILKSHMQSKHALALE